ncbi:hypothetical protein [Bradyrhizobium yuanmingense]|uniref:hypothetical protein n=1 Tax=Bradyrhizobium yuanmingense TaxID=108015 RepID=UPI0012E39165|nr:hypothetical protein [Bradyrhizobium yuanmingense]
MNWRITLAGPSVTTVRNVRRVLDHLEDEAMPLPASVASDELQRLEKQWHDEFHGLGVNHPALSFPTDAEEFTLTPKRSFSVDQEEFTLDPDQFSPGELRRLLDDEPAEELRERRDDHPRM